MWPQIGVPPALIAAPAGVIGASREFVLELRRLALRGITQAIVPDIRLALDRLSMRLEQNYEQSVVDAVFDWGERYVVRSFGTWDRWSLLLTSFAHHAAVGLEMTLRPASYEWLLSEIQRLYGPAATAEVQDAARAARALPLLPVEGDLVIIDAGSRGPSDEELVDVVLPAVVIAWRHRAYTFWSEARGHLAEDEIRAFIEAARERAVELQLDPAGVVDPARD